MKKIFTIVLVLMFATTAFAVNKPSGRAQQDKVKHMTHVERIQAHKERMKQLKLKKAAKQSRPVNKHEPHFKMMRGKDAKKNTTAPITAAKK
jgi:hypothetical protein